MPEIQDRTGELEQFKTGINLTEYAAHLGYEMDRRASSRHSAVVRRRSAGGWDNPLGPRGLGR